MSKTCNNCTTDKKPTSVPYQVVEDYKMLINSTIKRLWVVIIILIFLLVGSNCAWLWYESQFETVETVQEVVQEADNGENHFIGGDVIGETDYTNNN